MTGPETEPDFDVIVVGAGPAGAAAAYRIAEQGRSVVLVERGDAPGAKNLSGGVLYGRVLDDVFPGWVDEAPVERRITRHVTTFLTADSSVGIDYASATLTEPVNAVTVLRARFDPWLAGKAEEAGAFLMPGVRVDALLTEPGSDGDRRVVGVQASSGRTWSSRPTASTPSSPEERACVARSRATTWLSVSRPSWPCLAA